MLNDALDLRLRTVEVAAAGQGPEADALTAAAQALPFLSRTVLRASSAAALAPAHPAQAKVKAAHGPAAFVCVGQTCSLPVTEPAQIAETVNRS